MRIDQLQHVRGRAQSHADRSSGVIRTREVMATYSGMNSPYVSHRTVTFAVAQDLEPTELLVFGDSFGDMLILGGGPDAPESWERVAEPVPTEVVMPVIRRAIELGMLSQRDWIVSQPVVHVTVYRRKVKEWEADGRPVFALDNDPSRFSVQVSPKQERMEDLQRMLAAESIEA